MTAIVFVDTNVAGYAGLVAAIDPALEVFLIDAGSDGIRQMAEVLAGRSGIDAIHVVSHGQPGSLSLGSATLDRSSIAEHVDDLRIIGASLQSEGDLLFYGCNVGQGDAGLSFIAALADATGADVAASTDYTGATFLGGDWLLEAATGPIETGSLSGPLPGLLPPAPNTAPTFGSGDGKISTSVASGDDYAYGLAVQADGKIVLAGYGATGGNDDIELVRYNADGSLDTGFSGDGKVSTAIGTIDDRANAVALQADGKILVTGVTYGGTDLFMPTSDLALLRYNADGSLDTGFDGDGKLTTDFNGGGESGYDVIVQPDGKILVAGQGYGASNTDFVVARYNADGSLDTGFGGDGKVTTPVSYGSDYGHAIVLQADGRILVAGNGGSSDQDFALVRYLADGSLDTTFSGDGIATTYVTFGSYDDIAYDMAVQEDGKILLAGSTYAYSHSNFALVRFLADGTLDTSFDGDGIVSTDFGGTDDTGQSVAVRADGTILVAGYTSSGGYDIALARYNTDGSLDTTFDGDGKLTTAIGSSIDFGLNVAVQDGTVLVAGSGTIGSYADFALVRYNADGSLDTTFDANILNGRPAFTENGAAVVLDSDVQVFDAELAAAGNYGGASLALARNGGANGQDVFSASGTLGALAQGGALVVGGTAIGTVTTNGGGSLLLDFNGSATQTLVNSALQQIAYANTSDAPPDAVQIDWTFSDGDAGGPLTASGSTRVSIAAANDAPTFKTIGDGKLTTAFGIADDYGYGVVVQADGKILVAGYSYKGSNYDFALARYNADGSLDTAFDADGKLTTAIGTGPDYGRSVALQAGGQILVAGYSHNGSDNDFALARYNADGSLDTAFDGDGKVTTGIGTSNDYGYGVVVQTDGRILVAGVSVGTTDDFALVRYMADGSLDTAFGTGGKVTTAFGTGADQGRSVALQADGKILVAGYSNNGTDEDFALARYDTDGSLDTTFDGDGKATTALSASSDRVHGIVVQADGKILVAGESNANFALARYNTNGSLDTSFDTDGMLVTAMTATTNRGYSVAVQADGKILVAGMSSSGNYDFALARYNADGSLDTSFDGDGKVATAFGTSHEEGRSIVVQADGRILVAGSSNNGSNYDFALARYNADGSLDTRFDMSDTLNATPAYTENGAAVVLDSSVEVFDAELAAIGNYGGASVTLARSGGANAQDVFSAGGNLAFSGGNALLSGVAIATVANAAGTLTLAFNPAATQARVNEALSSIAYANGSDAPPAAVQIGWTFSDGALSAAGSTTVNITAVNDAPANTVPGAQSTNEDTTWTFGAANGNAITVGDADIGAGTLTTVVSVLNGTLNVAAGSGAAVTANGTASVNIAGTAAQVNAALNGLVYAPAADYNGADTLTVSTGDGSLGDTDTIALTVNAVNDAPVNTVPAAQGTDEDTALVFGSAGGNAITVADVDSGGGGMTTVVSVLHGILTAPAASWPMVSGEGSARITVAGTAADINAALDGLVYLPAADYHGADTLTVTTGDGSLQDTDTVALTVHPVNDAPGLGVGDGRLTTDIWLYDGANDVALQPDGRILVVGGIYDGTGGSDFALLRYEADGGLDAGFGGGDGIVTTDIARSEGANDVALQPDGRILVAGSSWGGDNNDFALLRYNADGSLDAGFGADGIVTADIASWDWASGVALQPDGRILVVGSSWDGSNSNFELLRCNADGSLDTGFGTGGIVTTDIALYDGANGIALLPDGRILVVGHSGDGSRRDFALVRYNADGSPDGSFDTDGIVTTGIALSDIANAVAVQPDGRILVAGSSWDGDNNDVALARYNADGSLDAGFGTGGIVTTAIAPDDSIDDIALQPDGRILVAGESGDGDSSSLVLARYNADGSLDTSFDGDGIVTADFGGVWQGGYGIVVQPDGRIVVAGYSDDGISSDFVLVRYNPDGSPDRHFGYDYDNILTGAPVFTEGGDAVVLDAGVQVFDAELAAAGSYGGARLTVARQGGADADDVFSGSGELDLSGGFAVLGGVPIGTLANAGGSLTIDFIGSASQARVNQALQSIAYGNASDAPPESVEIDWTFGDGGGLSATGSTTVSIVGVNDAPTLAQALDDQIAGSGQDWVWQIPAGAFADADDATLAFDARLASGDALPDWLTFDAGSRTLSGTPGDGDAGSVDIRITATDGGDLSAGDTFRLTVLAGVLSGTSGSDTVTGGGGADTLAGSAGVDSLAGGDGDDTYLVGGGDSGGEIHEEAGGGIDTISASGSFDMSDAANVENLVLLEGGNFDGTGNGGDNGLFGNSGDNVLDGAGGNDTIRGGGGDDSLLGGGGRDRLFGDSGSDSLDGGAGGNRLTGGDGDDTYYVYRPEDLPVERAGGGTDTVISAIDWTLMANFENLTAADGFAGLALRGNREDNVIAGNDGDNALFGLNGADTLRGGGGNDVLAGGRGDDMLTGGGGADLFAFRGNEGADTITDFEDGVDFIELRGVEVDAAWVAAHVSGTAIDLDLDGTADIVLAGFTGVLSAADFA